MNEALSFEDEVFVCALASEYLVASGAKMATINTNYAAADLRDHI